MLTHSRKQFDSVLPGVLQIYLLTHPPHFFFFSWYYARTYFGKGERADLQFPTYDIFLWVLLLHLNVWLRGEKDKWDMSGILFIDASSYSIM